MPSRGLSNQFEYDQSLAECERNSTNGAEGPASRLRLPHRQSYREGPLIEGAARARHGQFLRTRRRLAQRNARIFYSGSVVCWTGSWVQRIATDWLAWQLTHSTLWVGVIAFCTLVPSVVVSPIAGAVADRVDRVKLTMVSQYVAMSQSIILVVLILTGTIRIEFMALVTAQRGRLMRSGSHTSGASGVSVCTPAAMIPTT